MSVYFLANIKINKQEEYQRYLDKADAVFSNYKGKYLAVDKNPEVLEGEWNGSRAVLIYFESREDFNSWYRSEEYQEILQYRLSGSESNSILIEGNSYFQ